MTQYETILGKIAPVFYKFVQYEKYIKENIFFVFPYLFHLNLPGYSNSFFITEKIYYFYDSDNIFPHYFFGKNVSSNILINFGIEKINKSARYFTYPTIIIVNMILNDFSFENERLFIIGQTSSNGLTSHYTVKDLFIAMVGKDTYETIRKNIK
jgi:hypothetical protein